MADTTGFLKFERQLPPRRPVDIRILDWKDVYLTRETGEDEVFPVAAVRKQAARCMDCGIPFCHHGCPLGNLIPEWNDLARRDDWQRRDRAAARDEQLPGVHREAVPRAVRGLLRAEPAARRRSRSSRSSGRSSTRPSDEGWVAAAAAAASAPARRSPSSAPGPAGLAAAQQLTRAGHDVTVYERADRIGGLLRYGIPEFKMEKAVLDRRLDQMRAEGTRFVTGVEVGGSRDGDLSAEQLRDGVRRRRARRRGDRRPRPARAGPRARRHPPGHGVPAATATAGARRARRPADQRRRQARRDHRRR